MKIQIEREDLASLLYLIEKTRYNFELDYLEYNKINNLIFKFRDIIKEFDEQQEQKEIGSKWKQKKLF